MHRTMLAAVFAAFVLLLAPAAAAPDILGGSFDGATDFNKAPAYTPMAKPDYMGGNSFAKMHCEVDTSQPLFNNFWQVRRYDSKHHIVLAYLTQDVCGAALFVVPKLPAIGSNYGDIGPKVPNVDLSSFGTGRGLHIGSTYQDVLAVYGGKPTAHSGRFVLGYGASAYAHSLKIGHPLVQVPERITIVIRNNRVTSISFYLEDQALD